MEPIKQEIINNIFENGDKLITGPILQTVLIDMIDDVNVKDQEILSKTGSWDNAATQIPNLATKAEVTNLSESVARDLTGYATEQWVQNQGYLTEHQDISGLATRTELTAAENNLQGNITSLSESVARDIANVSVPEGVATEAWVQSQDYASKSYVDNAVSSSSVDLTGYATETWVQNQGYLTEHQDISNLATKAELTSVSESVQTDISNLATKGELNEAKNNLQGNITSLSESVANSAVWKKGEGTDSIVQAIADGTNLPTATGKRAIATGYGTEAPNDYSHAEGQGARATGAASHAEGLYTNAAGGFSHTEGWGTVASGMDSHAEGVHTQASGYYSHAEGENTEASGQRSHAEGYYTTASGESSHAEGGYTSTSNQYEHAQGQYNHNSTNQIFSVGAGEKIGETVTRRNAVSILEVPNSDTQIVTASFFVQNIGGYDGTNPEPGTNDLATVINNLPSGGGSSETLWKKGTGEDSLVQKLTGNNEANTPTATGTGAIAIGSQTTASGLYSHAEGDNTNASEQYSHAEGYYSKASGLASHAEGYRTRASGYSSHAEGDNTEASGQYSHAEGYSTVTSNAYEHAQGKNNHTSPNQIFSIGTGNSPNDRRNAVSVLEVSNNNSYTSSFFVQNIGGYDGTNPTPGTNDLATVINGMSSGGGSSETLWKNGEGKDSIVQAIADGTNLPTASGERAIATGKNTIASGSYSHAEGDTSIASGQASHAEGLEAKATGDYSHAEGTWTRAAGYGSHVEGYYTKASGRYSHARGYETEASGENSHAEGYKVIASGKYSHAEGCLTSATNRYEHAQGICNHTSTNQIFSVGAGEITNPDYPDFASAKTRRNALSVLAVPNSGSYTSSFFVQNIGGYDGTNPLPGTNDLATVISGLSSGGGSSETLWKRGKGTDSIVQIITEDKYNPRASGLGAVAIGNYSHAEGNYSHAEGEGSHAGEVYSHAEGYATNTGGQYSHAEGFLTTTAGKASHAEGYNTSASNDYEHAQGINNHSSANQIFSVGAGDSIKDPNTQVVTETRRNAISILSVPNAETQINTASFFVQNVGGYDGTNPIPGTNDLATVLNNTETWTFTLEDGSTVTKNIVMR